MAVVCLYGPQKAAGYCGDDEASLVFSFCVTTYKNPSMTRAYGLKCLYAAITQLHCIGESSLMYFAQPALNVSYSAHSSLTLFNTYVNPSVLQR